MSKSKTPAKPRVLRQSFLTFNTVPRQSTHVLEPIETKASRPAPPVPREIWMRILEDLSPIVLKSLRLVCKEWSNVARYELFRTVYLDSFEQSWLRLQELSKSSVASLVETIIWSPLYLPASCIDADIWRSRYVNLLGGLSHTKCTELYRIYQGVSRREAAKTYRPGHLLEGLSDLSAFTNCRKVAISDKIELEKSCTDVDLRRRIQQDQRLLSQAAIWGISPFNNPFLTPDPNQNASFTSMHDVYLLMGCLSSVSSFSSCLWIFNDFSASLHPSLKLRNVECVEIQHCFYHFDDLDLYFNEFPSMQKHLRDWMKFAAKFPNLRSLAIKSLYTDPGAEFNKQYRRKYLQWINEDFSDDDSKYDGYSDDESINENDEENLDRCTLSSAGSRLSQFCSKFTNLPIGFARTHVDTVESELTLGIEKMPKLKELSICGLALNSQSLLGWLANQPQLADTGIIIHLQGSNILYGLDPHIFLQLLEALRVHLVFNDDQTLYYVTDRTGQTTDFYSLSFTICPHDRVLGYMVHFRSDTDDEFYLSDLVEYAGNEPRHLSDIFMSRQVLSERFSQPCVTFIDRPSDIVKLLRKLSFEAIHDSHFYYCCISSDLEMNHKQKRNITFQWLNHPQYCQLKQKNRNEPAELQVSVLLEAYAYRDDYDDYGWWDYAHHEVELAVAFENEAEQILEQDLLRLYENELLRLDISEE